MVEVSALSGDVMSSMDINVSEDPTEQWKALDEAWVEQNLSVIQRAFAWFTQNGEWSEPQSLRRCRCSGNHRFEASNLRTWA